jgi:hypothetical protein
MRLENYDEYVPNLGAIQADVLREEYFNSVDNFKDLNSKRSNSDSNSLLPRVQIEDDSRTARTDGMNYRTTIDKDVHGRVTEVDTPGRIKMTVEYGNDGNSTAGATGAGEMPSKITIDERTKDNGQGGKLEFVANGDGTYKMGGKNYHVGMDQTSGNFTYKPVDSDWSTTLRADGNVENTHAITGETHLIFKTANRSITTCHTRDGAGVVEKEPGVVKINAYSTFDGAQQREDVYSRIPNRPTLYTKGGEIYEPRRDAYGNIVDMAPIGQ